MGAWGVKINQNDVYADVKDFYTGLLRYGMNDCDALKGTLKYFNAYINDQEDGAIFWLSLAEIMWQLGRLTDEVKEKAVAYIDSQDELSKWYEISQERGDERKNILDNLKEKLDSLQPEKKKFGKKRYKKCSWTNGDIYRYTFTGEEAEKYNMIGMYMFVQKIDDYFEPDYSLNAIKSFVGDDSNMMGDILPMIRLWITSDSNYIPSADKRNDCIPNYGNIDRDNPKDYRFYIFNFPGKSDKFEFICNSDIIVPDNEDDLFIKTNSLEPRHLTWKFFDELVIGRYLFWTKGISIFSDN